MNTICESLNYFRGLLHPFNAELVAVSKTKNIEQIMAAYDCQQRVFGENYVQELVVKQKQLPEDIQWHFIGHLQRNKVKLIAPFISLIHTIDSWELLIEIDKQAAKYKRTIQCLLQIYIAQEDTKFGLAPDECKLIIDRFSENKLHHVRIVGLMGMASNTDNHSVITNEFKMLSRLFNKHKSFFESNGKAVLSMGMTSDYQMALQEGSNMIRVGSAIFGNR
jgi:pyridoxal phosphate enzyme (YggS family)